MGTLHVRSLHSTDLGISVSCLAEDSSRYRTETTMIALLNPVVSMTRPQITYKVEAWMYVSRPLLMSVIPAPSTLVVGVAIVFLKDGLRKRGMSAVFSRSG